MAEATILFADNAPDFLKTRAEFLEQDGYRVIQATELTQARRILERGEVDLAILDIRMQDDDDEKDKSGLTLAQEVARSLPKIILTAYPSVDAVREALSLQPDGLPAAVGFVSKQEGPEELIRAMRHALESTRSEAPSWWIQRRPLIALFALLLALGTGVLAMIYGDPRWLLGTVLLAILAVFSIGTSIE